MSNGVQFDIDNEPRAAVQTKVPKLVQFVIKYSGGLVKDSTQANYVLLGFVVLVFIISYFIAFGGGAVNVQPSVMPPLMPAV